MGLQAYFGVSQTGYFGPLTESAVMRFQGSEGLSQVGIVGPQTRAAFARRCGGGGGNRAFSATPTYGAPPLSVSFTATKLTAGNGYSIDYGDGTSDEIKASFPPCPAYQSGLNYGPDCGQNSGASGYASHTYTSVGTYTAKLENEVDNEMCRGVVGCMVPARVLGTVTITVTNDGTGGSGIISGIDGPTTLQVGQVGLWTVRVDDASGYLSYSVRWGDEAYLSMMDGTSASASVSSSGTFTHAYSNAGAYSPTFTVTNGNGQSASASATVQVGGGSTGLNCTSDSQCPSSRYSCEATSGTATACAYSSSGVKLDPDCQETTTIVAGICKLKPGGACTSDSNCSAGNLCHAGVCTNPIGRQCTGASDTSCSAGYQCVQGCGSPVSYPGEPSAPYYCELNEYAAKPKICPICLAKNTLIDTPTGAVAVQDLKTGTAVWTTNSLGARVSTPILGTSHTVVPPTHHVVHLVLDDGRELFVSPGHPTADGRTAGDVFAGDLLDGSRVKVAELIPYQDPFTYDILPAGATGSYWAGGILMGSTLFR